MTEKWMNKAFAVIFLIVGIMASVNTYRIHNYIQTTVPWDVAQERCNDETLHMLEQWVIIREKRDAVEDARDAAVAQFLDDTAEENGPTPEQVARLHDAIRAYRQAWVAGDLTFETHALPTC